MSNKRIKKTKNSFEAENNEQCSRKRSLSINSSHGINKKKPGMHGKRYKSLLICVICNGDAHGN